MAANGVSNTQQLKFKGDDWKELAASYTKVTEGPTMPPIKTLLRLLNERQPLSKATSILDTGCGPGVVLSNLLKNYGASIPESATLRAADFSSAMVEQVDNMKAREIEQGNEIWRRVQTAVMDAQELKDIEDNSVSHVTAGFVLMLVPEPRKALEATRRVLTDDNGGGVLAFSCWKGSEWIDMMSLISKVRPDKSTNIMPQSWMSVDGVKGELEATGYTDVHVEEVGTVMEFEDHEATARFFMEKLPNMRQYAVDMSKEEIEKTVQLMTEYIKNLYPVAPAAMKGTALVGVGRKPPKGRL